jgi:hypothetical protein
MMGQQRTKRGPKNPFSRQGVADFGVRQKTCVFDYMSGIRERIHAYLRSESRVGGDETAPLAISGIHGSGKTHLLNWLADEITGVGSARARCLYAKADSDSFGDLYRELLKNLSRGDIIDLINDSVHRLAEAKVKSAKISEGLGPSVRNAPSLDVFVESGYLDTKELEQTLRWELTRLDSELDTAALDTRHREEFRAPDPSSDGERRPEVDEGDRYTARPLTGFASTLAKMIVLVDDEELGDAAFIWLRGESVSDPKALGVPTSLFAMARTGQRSSADTAAIDALESLAALFRIAERPLVVMIDQAEVFARSITDQARRETIFSLVKKFVEQLKREGVLVIISGAPDAWEGIRRDIWPRLSNREPIPIGHLTLEETKLMLETYTGTIKGLSPEVLQVLHTISGGIPREIVRIGHQAFARVQGNWSDLSKDLLKSSAVDAGTIKERELFALDVIDKVLVAYDPSGETGRGIQKDLVLDGGIEIKRLLRASSGQTLSFTMLSSTDPLTEADAASQVGAVAKRVHQDFTQATHLVIAIGYSSEEVRQILEPTSVVIGFDEKRFESELRRELAKCVRPGAESTAGDQYVRLAEALASLESKLNALSQERRVAVSGATEQLAERLEERAAPEVRAKELRTRWELIDILDNLQEKLRYRVDPVEERRAMRSLLVANELNIRSPVVDYGGALYMDLIDEDLRAHDEETMQECARLRSKTITILRRLLRPRSSVENFLERPALVAAASLIAVLICALLVALLLALSGVPLFREAPDLSSPSTAVFTGQGVGLFIVTLVSLVVVPVYSYRLAKVWASAPFREVVRRMEKVVGRPMF